jgi:hypothetical protein
MDCIVFHKTKKKKQRKKEEFENGNPNEVLKASGKQISLPFIG